MVRMRLYGICPTEAATAHDTDRRRHNATPMVDRRYVCQYPRGLRALTHLTVHPAEHLQGRTTPKVMP